MNNGINFGTRSDIIAAIPSLLGYIPTESFVIILLDRTDGQTTVRCAIRGDIDTKLESVATLPTTAAAAFHGADSAILLTISGPWHDTTATTVLNTLRDALESKNIQVRARMIARDTNQPHQWWDIDTNTSGTEGGNADTTTPSTPNVRSIAADRDTITREFTPTLNLAPISKQPITTFLVDTFEEIATAAAAGYAPSLSLATRAAIIITSSTELRDTMILVSIDHPENAAQLWTSLANQLLR
ncbi:MAG: DUF4192 family protein [Mycolicibacterium sp.]|uniref:DUF4192 family protein n=1 Tax=Mycolicibacterium sp. TaxID=2320850 RepID=UPI003D0F07F7